MESRKGLLRVNCWGFEDVVTAEQKGWTQSQNQPGTVVERSKKEEKKEFDSQKSKSREITQ